VILFSIHNDEWKSFQSQHQTALWYKRRGCSLIPAESNSLPHAHAQTTKTYYKHQDSRIKNAQVHTKTKTSVNSNIQDLPLRYQGRLLASFQDDAKYEHVGQETRSLGGKDNQDKQGKDLEISEQKTKLKDNEKAQDQRSHSMEEQAYNIIKTKDSRTRRQSNLKKFKEISERPLNTSQTFLSNGYLSWLTLSARIIERPPLLEPNGFCFWKARFEAYVKSKDIDLWHIIQNGDFYYEVEDSETKLMKETPYELLEDDQKKKLGKNNETKMALYNALPQKEYERVFMFKTTKEVWHTLIITNQGNSQVKNFKINLLTQEYEKFSISNEETIDSGLTRFNAIVNSLKSLDLDYSSKNHVRKFLRALALK
ncbi:hypothetical protein Tco_0530526, partial [Tanacetum coccineum]